MVGGMGKPESANTDAIAAAVAAAIPEAVKAALLTIRELNRPLTPEQISDAALGVSAPPIPTRRIRCRSDRGCTFTAVVAEAREDAWPPSAMRIPGVFPYPHGRVVRIEDYEYPEGVETPVDDGGLVPTGIEVRERGGQYTLSFLQWRRASFMRPDWAMIAGQPFQPRWALSPEEAAKPYTVDR